MISRTRPAPLIVLEGIDGSGKGTQAAQLVTRARQSGLNVQLLSFPRYRETFFGARIGEFLNGEYGTLEQLHPFLISLLYAGDRFESRDVLQRARQESDLVLLDRYVPSNIAHQSARLDEPQRTRVQHWIEEIEYELFQLPRPDRVFLLDLPVRQAQEFIRRKQPRDYTDRPADLQEADASYLERVRNVYLQLAERESDSWTVVPVASADGVRTVSDVSDDLFEALTGLQRGRDRHD